MFRSFKEGFMLLFLSYMGMANNLQSAAKPTDNDVETWQIIFIIIGILLVVMMALILNND